MADHVDSGGDTFEGCFGCGPTNPKGLAMRFRRERDEMVARVRLGGEYAGYEDFVHGGVVATMLDEAQGWALLNLVETYGVTRELNVTYRRPVTVGREIVVRGRLRTRDGSSIYLESSVEDDRGRLLAFADGHWVSVRSERALKRSAR